DLRISGNGEIDLLTHPAKLTSDVSGSGRIVEGGEAAPAQPAAPPPPAKHSGAARRDALPALARSAGRRRTRLAGLGGGGQLVGGLGQLHLLVDAELVELGDHAGAVVLDRIRRTAAAARRRDAAVVRRLIERGVKALVERR